MSRKSAESLVKLSALDDIACDIAKFLGERGVPSALGANSALFLYAKCVTACDLDEEQAIEALRGVLKQLRALRPS